MSDRLHSLAVFARIARLGSFSRAARDLGLSQPSASRLVASLERDIGTALFVRTTRAVSLTEAGQEYLARIEPVLAALQEADAEVKDSEELGGLLRVGVSSTFGRRELIPRLPEFLSQHPRLRIELRTSDRHQDLIAEGIDIAFRLGPMTSSTLIARLLGVVPRIVVASPAYLAARNTPSHPSELAEHDVIVGPARTASSSWLFRRGSRTASVTVSGRLITTENEAAVTAAVAGLGITITSMFGCREELGRGDLVQLFDGWSLDPIELHAVFPPSLYPKRSARALADHMLASCRRGFLQH
jgi:DNA-binding transcriptional LysR family regulator